MGAEYSGELIMDGLENMIISCIPLAETGAPGKSGIEGTRFSLDNMGDVTWTLSEGAKQFPLFQCETYEVYKSSLSGVVLRFGAGCTGHIIEFRAEHPENQDTMLLSCESWCLLQCRRVFSGEFNSPVLSTFSLLPALEEGYFSDLTITAANNKQFAVHTCILKLGAPSIDWAEQPPPLSGLPEDVLGTVLHFIYSESLPANLDEDTARQCRTVAQSLLGLEKLVNMCDQYLNNMALKQQIVKLVSDMHACAHQIIGNFSSKTSTSDHLVEPLSSNPAKLCYVVKQSVREAAVAFVKLLELCDLYCKHKPELSRKERHEIVHYAKSRLPIFMSQLHRFLQAVKVTFSAMSPSQRQDMAAYLVLEIEGILDMLAAVILEVKSAVEQLIVALTSSEVNHSPSRSVMDTLKASLKSVSTRESFNDMTSANKVRSVSRNLEQLIEELPIFLLRLEEVMAALDDKLEWREFKFCFKVGTAKVCGVLEKMTAHCSLLQSVLVQLCDLVQRDAFTHSLLSLKLLDPAHYGAVTSHNNQTVPSSIPKHAYKLNLVESLCMPPKSCDSVLSKSAMELLRSSTATDMSFQIMAPQESPEDCVEDSMCCVQAHRVIVAARCDWFRRALLSGMREAIDRRVIIHDTSQCVFSSFLDYLYSGKLDTCSFSADHLADLMLLSDRYEVDSLKLACEHGLKSHIDRDSVLYFLGMADQIGAKILRSSCLYFVSTNPDIMDTDLFEELPQTLQAEIYDMVIWVKPSRARTEIECMNVDDFSQEAVSDSSSVEDLHDTARLETCLAELRHIVGEHVLRERLVQVALAADYDVNRALNFYYSS
uniref:BTB domain-containing protein n=1 Tax=Timema shepardi TaxID=629360 RepID=A0A7R9B3E1_TIMSH|nr:unnamed protein product [Timema shepardi]